MVDLFKRFDLKVFIKQLPLIFISLVVWGPDLLFQRLLNRFYKFQILLLSVHFQILWTIFLKLRIKRQAVYFLFNLNLVLFFVWSFVIPFPLRYERKLYVVFKLFNLCRRPRVERCQRVLDFRVVLNILKVYPSLLVKQNVSVVRDNFGGLMLRQ